MATIRLFDTDAYMTNFEAAVLSCEEAETGKYKVVLDQTAFFPEEGGQTPDKGILGGANVLDVSIDKTEVITHLVDKEFAVGEKVCGEIDWQHRFSNMQQHSGEHIFSGLVYKAYGYQNVGFHLSDQIVTMDFDGPLTKAQIEELEEGVNRVIAENVAITAEYPTDEELEKLEYRSKKELDGAIRIVTIEGYDVCACCAPHVARTGEIGGFRVQNVQNYKGGVRISMLCGLRALYAERQQRAVLEALTALLTTSPDRMEDAVAKLKAENQSLKSQINLVKQEQLLKKLEQEEVEGEDIFFFEKDLETPVMRAVVNAMMERYEGYCGVFSGDEESGYQFIIGSQKKDCRQAATLMREQFQAKGGGSDRMIQGSVTATEAAIRAVY